MKQRVQRVVRAGNGARQLLLLLVLVVLRLCGWLAAGDGVPWAYHAVVADNSSSSSSVHAQGSFDFRFVVSIVGRIQRVVRYCANHLTLPQLLRTSHAVPLHFHPTHPLLPVTM